MGRVLFWVGLLCLFALSASALVAPRLDDSRVSALFAPVAILAAVMTLRPGLKDQAATVAAFLAAMLGRAVVLGGDPGGVLGFLAVDVLEAGALSAILRRFGGRGFSLNRPANVLLFISTAILVAAAGGVLAVALTQAAPGRAFGEVAALRIWLDWTAGDATAHLSIGAACLLLGRLGLARARGAVKGRAREFSLATLTMLLAVVYDFQALPAMMGDAPGHGAPHPALLFLSFPAIVWLALRFPEIGAATAMLLAAVPAMHLAAAGWGPIWLETAQDRTLVLQAYIAASALAALCLSAAAWRVLRRERALRAALALAQRRAQQRVAFIATINHEIRTPLNGVIGMTQLLRAEVHGPLSSRYRELLVMLEHSAQRLLALTTEFLDVSRIAVLPIRVEFAPVALHEAVGECIAIAQSAADVTGVRLVNDVDPDTMIGANAIGLRHALTNLLANAVRHSPPGGVVTVCAARGERFVTVEVRDEGEGFPEDISAEGRRILRGDQRAGIGLQLVESIMALHDGQLQIDRGPGGCVRLLFPLDRPT